MRLADLIEQAQAGVKYWVACTIQQTDGADVTVADGWLIVRPGIACNQVSLQRGKSLRRVDPSNITMVQNAERWEPVE